jgi:hypothetical protein
VRRALKALWLTLILGLAFVQAGCRSGLHPWVPPEDCKVKIISDAAFVRTSQGDYVDGYLAEYNTDFRKERMFMALEIPHYLKGDRLIATGRFTGDSVRMSFGDQKQEKVPVFLVERAAPNIPSAPGIPTLK